VILRAGAQRRSRRIGPLSGPSFRAVVVLQIENDLG
jgi:hypothetical protein